MLRDCLEGRNASVMPDAIEIISHVGRNAGSIALFSRVIP